MTLQEAFGELIRNRGWYKGSGYIQQQADHDKQFFLQGKRVPESRMREYLRAAGWKLIQEEQWKK